MKKSSTAVRLSRGTLETEASLKASKKKLSQLEKMQKTCVDPEARAGLQKRIDEEKAVIRRCNEKLGERYSAISKIARHFSGEEGRIEKRGNVE